MRAQPARPHRRPSRAFLRARSARALGGNLDAIGPDDVLALQELVGNEAVQRIIAQRQNPAPAPAPTTAGAAAAPGTAVPRTERASIHDASLTIFMALNIGGLSGAKTDRVLRTLLLQQDRIGELRTAYEEEHHQPLDQDLAKLDRGDELRAHEYMDHGRLTPVAKVLLAIDVAGTVEEVLWRVLPDAFNEGDPAGKWARLVSQQLPITRDWASKTLDEALASDLSGNDLDRARALVRFGRLRPVDKIRVATNQVGTDEDLLFEGLTEADRATIGAEYQREYSENLETVLFDQYDDEGNLLSQGELSGRDADRARVLLDVAASDPLRLVRLVQAATAGVGTDTDAIWRDVGDAVRRAGATPPDANAAAQVAELRRQVSDPADPLGLRGWTGDLGEADHARLRALLGIAETSTDVPGAGYLSLEVLNDPLVQRLRGQGGVDNGSTFETLLKAGRGDWRAYRAGFNDDDSNFHRYLWQNVTLNSGEWGELSTVFNGSLYARLRLCAGGLRDDYEEYAYALLDERGSDSHATDDERRALRGALREKDRSGEFPATDAGRAMAALDGAFSTSEMAQVRSRLRATRVGILDEAADLEADVERERSWWFGVTADLSDEERELQTGLVRAGLDATIDPTEEAGLRGGVERTRAALDAYVQLRDEITGYVSQVVQIAAGLLVTAVTGGAAGPAVAAALVRAAVASAIARVVTEKALRGDRFDTLGGDGARAFVNGAVDGVMNCLTAGAAANILERVTQQEVRTALEQGTASLGLRLANSALEGSMGGGVGGMVDAATNEDTWRRGVADGLLTTLNSAITSAGQGALISMGTTAAHAGLGAAADRIRGRGAGLIDAHPLVGMARGGDDAACAGILDHFGRWETAMADLQAGSGKAADMSEAVRHDLRDKLVAHRARIRDHLGAEFEARPQGGASTEPGSDMDFNVGGENAGRNLLNARRWLDENHPGWETRYRMGLMIDSARIQTVWDHLAALPAAERAAVQARISREGELLMFAREVRGTPPEGRAALLDRLSDTTERARVEQLANMDEAARRHAHDTALLEGDRLSDRLRGETDPAERARLAEEITRQQMLANAMGDEAYITPGGVRGFAEGRRLTTAHEQVQALLDQVGMIGHLAHEHGGVLNAMRRYEIFKYIRRVCEVIEQAIPDASQRPPELEFFKNWADLVYRVDRAATSSPEARVVTPESLAGSTHSVGVRHEELDVPVPGVSDRFLADTYGRFRDMVNGQLPGLRERAAEGGSVPPALVELPAIAPDEVRPTTADPATDPAVTRAGTVAPSVRSGPALPPGEHRVVGSAVASEAAGHTLIRRLAQGDAAALAEIGVTPPAGFDPRSREWGLGQRSDGSFVIVQGGPESVSWSALLNQGVVPAAHSHPLTPAMRLDAPNRTVDQIIRGGGEDRNRLLPSGSDIVTAAQTGADPHEVHTPYVHVGDGRVGYPAPGVPNHAISFRIADLRDWGRMGTRTVWDCLLVAYDERGAVLWTGRAYAVSVEGNGIISLEPIGTANPTAQPVTSRRSGGSAAAATGETP